MVAAIHLRFRLDQPGVIGWQLYDPTTGAYLQEGEWSEMTSRDADLRIPLPGEEGDYSVQVAPVENRTRYIEIAAHVGPQGSSKSEPRVCLPLLPCAARDFCERSPRRLYCPLVASGAIAS